MNVDLIKIFMDYRDYYGRYHNHKETMAWLATGLYLYAIYYIMHDKGFISKIHDIIYLLYVIIIISFAFISWQFKQKQIASDIIIACTNIISNLLSDDDYKPALTRYLIIDSFWPQEVYTEIRNIIKSRKLYKLMPLSEITIYTAMIIWPVLIELIRKKRYLYELYLYIPLILIIILLLSLIRTRKYLDKE
jgi:hypothetical protein